MNLKEFASYTKKDIFILVVVIIVMYSIFTFAYLFLKDVFKLLF